MPSADVGPAATFGRHHEQNGVWQWFGVTCAEEHGFNEVYTNDRHMLRAAKHFHVTGVDVLSESS